jgi:hypothetical protein
MHTARCSEIARLRAGSDALCNFKVVFHHIPSSLQCARTSALADTCGTCASICGTHLFLAALVIPVTARCSGLALNMHQQCQHVFGQYAPNLWGQLAGLNHVVC